ncbi:recombinase family protein [Methylobacterium tarhaniae]|uniref:recombinase family protein n=1 Tax=Methylobacterium tarhaniae TaxID=1187852 RepID=UPI003D06E7EC
MIVGYARTSTLDQEAGLDAQVRNLEAIGCERIFQEQVSSIGPRKQLNTAMDFVRGRRHPRDHRTRSPRPLGHPRVGQGAIHTPRTEGTLLTYC